MVLVVSVGSKCEKTSHPLPKQPPYSTPEVLSSEIGRNQQFTYGLVSEGVFAESSQILRKVRGNLQNIRFIASGKGAEILWKVVEISRKFCGKFSAMTHSRTTP